MKTSVSNIARLGAFALALAITGCSGSPGSVASSAQSVVPATTGAKAPGGSAIMKAAGQYGCAYTSAEHFNEKVDIPAGSWLLFTSVFRVPSGQAGNLRFDVSKSYITFAANNQTYQIQVPGSRISLHSQSNSHLHWAKGAKHGIWWLMVPYGVMEKDYAAFMEQVAWQVPSPGLSGADFGGSNEVNWNLSLSTGKYVKSSIEWQWGAAVYTQLDNFPTDYNNLASKPVDDPGYSSGNGDPAGTPENNKPYLVDGGTNQGGQLDYIGGAEKNHVANVTLCGKP